MKERQNYPNPLQAASYGAGRRSLPFEFPERGDYVARAIFLEQLPMRPFAAPGLPGGFGERYSPLDQATHLAGEIFQIALFVGNGAVPVRDHWTVTGNDARRGNLR